MDTHCKSTNVHICPYKSQLFTMSTQKSTKGPHMSLEFMTTHYEQKDVHVTHYH
jgi:hypothetical protein